jgi:amino acid transporter/nucleotide-binding universal stress UspA family protein
MSETIQEVFEKKIRPVKFERTIGLFGATTIGVGALMGAGVYVLIGMAAGVAGPSVILSYIICGALAFLTTLMFAEMARLVPRAGGGYLYAYETLGSIAGFGTGWFLALGSMFACGLYAIGFAEYAVSITGIYASGLIIKLIAIAVICGFSYINTRPSSGKFNAQAWLTWGNLAILTVLVLFAIFHLDVENAQPAFPKGFGGTTAAISIIYISFFGYQLIANNADEIINPERIVPKAMKLSMIIAIAFYVAIALVAVFAIPWERLAATNAPLVVLANETMGGKAWLLISFGGVLASLAALNSTLVSQSRQIYVMGQHRFFPDALGKLEEDSKKPRIALMAGAVVVSIILLLFDLPFIAKSTSFCLLASLLPVSIALRKIYMKDPSKKPRSLWKRYLPEMALVANVALLFTLDIVSLAFGQQLALVGAAIYFLYSRKREKRSRGGLNINLQESTLSPFFRGSRILVPMSNPQTQQAIFAVSNALLSKKGGEIVVLSIKDTRSDQNFYEALSDADDTMDVIKRSIEMAKADNTSIRPVIRAARSIATGIIQAAEEEHSDLIITGYAPHKDGKPTIIDRVVRFSATDMIMLKLHDETAAFEPKNIGVCIKGTANLELMTIVATAIAEHFNGRLTLINILPKGYDRKQKDRADSIVIETISKLKSTVLYDVNVRAAEDPIEELINLSSEFDLMLIGIGRLALTEKAISESLSVTFTEQAKCSVIMLKEVSGVKKLMSKI